MPLATPSLHVCPRAVVGLRRTLFVLFYASLLVAAAPGTEAQYLPGLTTVGSNQSTPGPTPSKMSIDASQFFVQANSDFCGAVALACAELGQSGYPFGATIDARGMAGNQYCSAANATTMLETCVSNGGTQEGGGKLLLGQVNLYVDGPKPPAINYAYKSTDGPGTPAIVIPNGFWGIEGISRATQGLSGTPIPGSVISVCTGSGTPISQCNYAFPVRTAAISQIAVGGTSPVTMTLKLSTPTGPLPAYPQELVMVKGGPTAAGSPPLAGDNGTFAIRSVSSTSTTTTLVVAAPPGATNCGGSQQPSCGTAPVVFLGTPIVGFGPAPGMNYLTQSTPYYCMNSGNPYQAFGEHLKDLSFDCQGQTIEGCIGWQDLYAQEESGADTFHVENYDFVGVDIHYNAQNFGPVLNAEIYTGNSNTNCDYGTTGVYIGDKPMRGLNGWTINVPEASQVTAPTTSECSGGIVPVTAALFDAPNTEVRNGHCEGFRSCVLMGANNDANLFAKTGASGQHLAMIDGPPSGNPTNPEVLYTAQVSNNFPNTSLVLENIRKHTNATGAAAVVDNLDGVTLTDSFVPLYTVGSTSGAFSNASSSGDTLPNMVNVNSGAVTVYNSSGSAVFTAGPASVTLAKNNNEHFYRSIADQGTALAGGNVTLSSGWGSGHSLGQVQATDSGGAITIESGSGPSANPTVTITFADLAWSYNPTVIAMRGDANAPTSAQWVLSAISTSSVTLTFAGTPAANSSYGLMFMVQGRIHP